jgi:uncharacterized membrane protein YtjA (UPF0391 family)
MRAHGALFRNGFALAAFYRRRRFVPDAVTKRSCVMLSWALVFFVIALVAALFGFGGIAGASMGIAQILFFIFLVLFVISLIIGLTRGRTPPLA